MGINKEESAVHDNIASGRIINIRVK